MNTHAYAAALAELVSQPLDCDRAWLERVLTAPHPVEPVAVARRGAGSPPQSYDAILPLVGFMADRWSLFVALFGGTVMEEFLPALDRLAADPAIKRIFLEVDSPGGLSSAGHAAYVGISGAAKIKPVVAIINPFAASAAYHAIAGSSQILSVPAGRLGSIGTYLRHVDISEALKKEGVKVDYIDSTPEKTEMAPEKALTKEARDHEQGNVDALYASFVRNVSAGRNVTTATVRKDFGRGRLLLAGDAARIGMIDKVVESLSAGLQAAGKFPTHAQRAATERARELETLAGGAEELERLCDRAAEQRNKRRAARWNREQELQALERGLA